MKDNFALLAKCFKKSKWDTILGTFDVPGLYSDMNMA